MLQHAEVEHHDRADEDLEEQDELALRDQVRLARLVDQLRDLEHRRCTGRFLSCDERHQAEQQAERADHEAAHQQRPAVDAVELDRRQVRQHQVRFAAAPLRRRRRCARPGLPAGPLRRAGTRAAAAIAARSSIGTITRRHKLAYGHAHLTSHKSWDYTRTRGGSAMPPVRKMMPSSTVMSGNVARSRSQITMSPR